MTEAEHAEARRAWRRRRCLEGAAAVASTLAAQEAVRVDAQRHEVQDVYWQWRLNFHRNGGSS